ncbi:MAG: putative toxin-antitoxin system toxin component, PIN family [Gammaproteobacteria bacterium]|nr:putative toxin-antitoxin system toxin component, PIN family [Acidobacteriota bacterium]MXZ40117.1 putative toxin-antitoxin system toxin component, PIN family [Holophagales bacterium]MYJ73668.1 putative toxin-antitoxin system toxin component, PIN family [Gammaproteobacteria bacterium]
MRVVLDTNILVSALITKGTPPDQLYRAWLRGDVELVTSQAQIDELRAVLGRPRLRRYVDPAEADRMLPALHLNASVLQDVPVARRSPDPKDDPILAMAVMGEADVLVSGDKTDMLALKSVEGIPIATAREALSLVLGQSQPPRTHR